MSDGFRLECFSERKIISKLFFRVLLKCAPSPEQLKIDPFLYVSESFKKTGGKKGAQIEEETEIDEDEEPQSKKAVN